MYNKSVKRSFFHILPPLNMQNIQTVLSSFENKINKTGKKSPGDSS